MPKRLPPSEAQLLFFLHIPKTAGISLSAVLDANFPPGAVFEAQDWTEAEALIERMSTVELARVRCIRGHHWFGPGDRAVHDRFAIDPVTITVLRNPVARTVSAHQHVMRWPEHWLRAEIGITEDETMPLHEFVEHPAAAGEVTNLQTRLVVGAVPGNLPDSGEESELAPFEDEELLSMAKERLASFAWVGLTERMEESVRLLTSGMGWPPIERLPNLNFNPLPSAQVELTDETRAAILGRTALDAELYAYAGELLDRALAEAQIAG